MFNLHEAEAKIANFNPRAEKHGEDNKLAADIKIELSQSGSILEHWSSSLRAAIFREPASGEQQRLDGDAFTAVRHPRIPSYAWDEEYTGYELHISNGLGLTEPVVLVDVTLKKFAFKAIEGGSVAITFNAICHPDAEEAGALCELIQSTVVLTLIPPTKQADSEQDEDRAQQDAFGDHLDQAARSLETADA